MVDDNFEELIPERSTYEGVIFQRRSSVIKEVPRAGETEDATSESDHEAGDMRAEKKALKKSECTNTRPRRNRRAKVEIRNENDDSDNNEEWKLQDKKRHKCPNCSMRFKKPSALVIHTRTHSGERPYKCKQCPKRFSISGNLRRHMFTHTGEKPYKCQACGRAFNNPSHLARHSKKIHI